MSTAAAPVQRRLVFDGLRGVAALSVVLLHSNHFPERAYLAVDLFFLLSGFVVASAYEERLKQGGGLGWFFGVRMARLYALYLVGLVLGFLRYVRFDFSHAATAFAAGLAFIPFAVPAKMAYPLNPVSWTLMLELLVNVIYAAFAYRFSNRVLLWISVICGAAMSLAMIRAGVTDVGYQHGHFAIGFLRVGFSFPLGVLVYRLHRAGALPKVRVHRAVVLAAPLACFAITTNRMVDPLLICLVLPAVFVAALNAAEPRGVEAAVYRWAGRLSYSAYILHMSLIVGGLLLAGATGLPLWLAMPAVIVGGTLIGHLLIEPAGKRLVERISALNWGHTPISNRPAEFE